MWTICQTPKIFGNAFYLDTLIYAALLLNHTSAMCNISPLHVGQCQPNFLARTELERNRKHKSKLFLSYQCNEIGAQLE